MELIDLIVGTLGRAHGLSGEIFIDVRTDSPSERFRPEAKVNVGSRSLTVRSFRTHGGRGVIGFAEIIDRTAAEGLTGVEVTVKVDAAESPAEADEFYDHQLIGLTVVREEAPDQVVGQVSRVDAGERLVPFVNDLVPEVDLVARRVVIRAIPGLLEDIDEA